MEALNRIYMDERCKIVERWQDRNEDGSPIIIEGMVFFREHQDEFNMDLQELLNVENETHN